MPMARSIPTLIACVSLMTGAAIAEEPTFKTHTINGKSGFESAGVFDVDGDGQLDIVSGDTWYQAPSWTPSKVRDVVRQGTYYNDFATLPIDVNGDMKIDFVRARIGEFDVDLTREFFQGFVNHALVTLHIDNLKGDNAHHQAETAFKAFGRALRMAVELDSRTQGVPSTKGSL